MKPLPVDRAGSWGLPGGWPGGEVSPLQPGDAAGTRQQERVPGFPQTLPVALPAAGVVGGMPWALGGPVQTEADSSAPTRHREPTLGPTFTSDELLTRRACPSPALAGPGDSVSQ